MRLSGVDPSIIRELSGIYKPFIKAFKELISNAYDADAKKIAVTVAKDFSFVEVRDDGNGMTPWDFHQNFARLGGSTAWLQGGKSPGGRDRIGYKGIGFLAVARYCSELEVETRAPRSHRGCTRVIRRNRKEVPWAEIVGDLIPVELLVGRVKVLKVARVEGSSAKVLSARRDYQTAAESLRFRSAQPSGELIVEFEVDCSDIVLKASLDFDHLLSLEHRADLRQLETFCTASFSKAMNLLPPSFTKVRLNKLKEFVARELSAPPAKGKARNIAFKSGKEQFLWRLGRSSPILDQLPKSRGAGIGRLAKHQDTADLPQLTVAWREEKPRTIQRPVYEVPQDGTALNETVIPVNIKENGLVVEGYLLARTEVIYPAELRGISVRVRNVGIGDASFFGWETLLSGPRKAAMSQITGELRVLEGMDASDAINPGRESFYEESLHYRTLKRHLFGSDESVGGLVGEAIRSILDRIRVRSQVADKVAAAKQRRRALADISSAVNHFARPRGDVRHNLGAFFSTPVRANGLSTARDVPLRFGPTVAGFEVKAEDGLEAEFDIDFRARRVLVDYSQDAWSTSIYLGGHYYDVVLKQGRPEHPVCEFDNEQRRIFVNWAHPVKLQMDDVGFLKSAILLRLANHAAPEDADAMMDLALNMMAFRAE
jgi:hypothetical protein